jgi:hypothetical protein
VARIQRDVVNYFPHDAHASVNSDTLAVLEGQFGNDGYAFWFKLLEKLASTDGHFLDCNDARRWQVLLSKAHINNGKGVEILKLLIEMSAIDRELWENRRIIWCQKLVDNIADVYRNRQRAIPQRPFSIPQKSITTTNNSITKSGNTQIKLNKTKLLTPKGGQRTAQSTSKEKKDSIVNEIFAEMRAYLGYPDKVSQDPIPNYGKEGQAIKRMLTRGFTRGAIVSCWKSKVSQRGGEFVSMIWVNEDIGKPEKQRRKPGELSTEEEIAASIREVEK